MKNRLMVTVEKDIANTIRTISTERGISISQMINILIAEALEMQEDMYLSELADESHRNCQGKELISAEEVWKKCGL